MLRDRPRHATNSYKKNILNIVVKVLVQFSGITLVGRGTVRAKGLAQEGNTLSPVRLKPRTFLSRFYLNIYVLVQLLTSGSFKFLVKTKKRRNNTDLSYI